ncbi:recombination protein O N-terminal domain-containing protein [Ornithobacterium rhinotracheale]|nr:recombination protein O N-terminal domain-containing protein [Ornithobacterium rhinotracheale]
MILHLYTRELGMLAFMIKGFYKQKNETAACFSFAEVEISVEENTRGSLKHRKIYKLRMLSSICTRNLPNQLYCNF